VGAISKLIYFLNDRTSVVVLLFCCFVVGNILNIRKLGLFRNEQRNDLKTVKFYAFLGSELARTQKRAKTGSFCVHFSSCCV